MPYGHIMHIGHKKERKLFFSLSSFARQCFKLLLLLLPLQSPLIEGNLYLFAFGPPLFSKAFLASIDNLIEGELCPIPLQGDICPIPLQGGSMPLYFWSPSIAPDFWSPRFSLIPPYKRGNRGRGRTKVRGIRGGCLLNPSPLPFKPIPFGDGLIL